MKKELTEIKIWKYIEKYKFNIFFVIITVCSLIIRFELLSYISGDYRDFLGPWFYKLKQGGGLFALKEQIGNYNAPYMTIMALLTYIPINPLISIKFISIIFDYICAIYIMKIANELLKDTKNKKVYILLIYSVALFLPTVFLNSACWGQADSIYTAFVLISLLNLFKQKYTKAFVFLGIAFSFKLQTIFILPLYILMYISERKFSIFNFVIIPFMDFVMCIPAILFGKNLIDCVKVYFNQTKEYSQFLTMNFPNVYSLFFNESPKNSPNLILNTNNLIATIGIILTICIFIFIAVFVFYKKIKFDNKTIIEFGLWSILIATFFLPHMHDRYLYMADLIGILYLILNKKKYYIPLAIEFISVYTYIYYICGGVGISIQAVSILNFILIVLYSKDMFLAHNECKYTAFSQK